MQRARAMEGRRRSEDELRDGLPARPAHGDALRAARSAHGHLQRHQLRAHGSTEPARSAAAASPRAPAPSVTAPARARPPATARAAPARAGARRASAGRAAETAEARQEEAAAPRPVRPRPTTTAAAAASARDTTAAAAAGAAGARAEPEQRQPARSSGSRACLRPGGGASGLLPVHAVAAAEVGGDAEAARVLLGGVPVQLPDAGAGGHLQPRHRRQPAHHHLQRGEPQRLRHRLSAVGGRGEARTDRMRFPRAPYFHSSLPNCAGGEESGSLVDVCCTDKENGIVVEVRRACARAGMK